MCVGVWTGWGGWLGTCLAREPPPGWPAPDIYAPRVRVQEGMCHTMWLRGGEREGKEGTRIRAGKKTCRKMHENDKNVRSYDSKELFFQRSGDETTVAQ